MGTHVLKFSFAFLNSILYYSLQINDKINKTFSSSLNTYCKCNFFFLVGYTLQILSQVNIKMYKQGNKYSIFDIHMHF